MQHHPIIRIKKFLSIIITLKLIVFQHKTISEFFCFRLSCAGMKSMRSAQSFRLGRSESGLERPGCEETTHLLEEQVTPTATAPHVISAACAGWDVGRVHVPARAARAARQQGQVLQGQQGGGLAVRDTQGGDGAGQQLQVDRRP